FLAFDAEVLAEEGLMLSVLVELLRRQYCRYHRDLDFQLYGHQGIDDRVGDKLVPIDPAVDDEAAGHDCGVAAAAGEKLGMQRNLESAGHLVEIDCGARNAAACHLGEEGIPALVDDFAMPAGLHEGKTLIFSS